jgi:GNAT superfamily N-acetyltransferase
MTLPQGLTGADLAPGDQKSLTFDSTAVDFHLISDPADPWCDTGYDVLWREFGPRHEMEQKSVIHRRLQWNPAQVARGFSFMYRMVVATSGGRPAAVRDHTVILCHDTPHPLALVHLSHVWIDPAWRRSGLAGWMRALPVQTARTALDIAGLPQGSPIVLVAEMERHHPGNEEQWIRLQAYEKAGFRRADCSRIDYHQPDFRPPEEIDRSGGAHLIPLALMLRRVGREDETSISSGEILRIVFALYHMYGLEIRPQDMRVAYETLKNYPPDGETIALELPTRGCVP